MAENKSSNFPEDVIFEDAEDSSNWRASAGKGIKEIILKQYERCILEGSKEMSHGGILKRVIDGKLHEITVPDQVEIFKNSVEMLRYALTAHAKKHEDIMNPFFDNFDNKIKQAIKNSEKLKESIQNELGEISSIAIKGNPTIVHQFNRQLAEVDRNCEKEIIEAYKILFRGISVLLNELNYFDEGSTWN